MLFFTRQLSAARHSDLISRGHAAILVVGTARSEFGAISLHAEEVFGLPVRTGKASNLMGLSELVDSAEWTTGIGLLLHGRDRIAARGGDGAFDRVRTMINRLKRIASLY